MKNLEEVLVLAKKIWENNEEVATELANAIIGMRDGIYYKPEFEYPIFKKNKQNGSIVKFISLETREIIAHGDSISEAGLPTSIPHTNKNYWLDVPYDRERELYHGQPVYTWDKHDTHCRALKFYDALNGSIFTCSGCFNGSFYDNVEAISPEDIPDWMHEAYLTLEGI